ncbi:MAG: phasin family protein [Hyphomicrobiaceae bacterium]|nr:phasin family protein [Hyphomicrobiaceae bacterium]
MMNSFEDLQKASKDNMELAAQSLGAVSKGMQALAAEATDYTKKSIEEGSAVVEKLAGAKSLDKVIEVQSEYAKSAYEGFVGQVTKVNDLVVDMTKEAYKPFEGMFAAITK